MISSGVVSSSSFIYSYLFMGLLRYMLAMSTHINFTFFVDNTLLKMNLAVMISVVCVVMSPWKLIKFPPTVSLVQCVSAFCGLLLAKILP